MRAPIRTLLFPVVTSMRRLPSLIPAVLSIVLLGACGQALAAESRLMAADGAESCPDTPAASDRDDAAEADPNTPATPVRRTPKAKAVAAPRAGGGNRSTAPRWHSFLPGMFR